jgi:transcription termination/antitermination protein NusA
MSREILLMVDALAHEKNVGEEVIFTALELALASATKKRFHEDADIRVEIDRSTGDYLSFRRWTVVAEESMENPAAQIPVGDERAQGKVEGDTIEESLESIAFGRIGAQAAK